MRDLLRHSARSLLLALNWKTAAVSDCLRAAIFFFSNRHAGTHAALRAVLTEAAFSIVSAGLLGAVIERVRFAVPAWATALAVCLGLPLLLVPVQTAVHRWAGTAHIRTGVAVSFAFAALASALTLALQRRGWLLTRGGRVPARTRP